jgi:hypothetical protein
MATEDIQRYVIAGRSSPYAHIEVPYRQPGADDDSRTAAPGAGSAWPYAPCPRGREITCKSEALSMQPNRRSIIRRTVAVLSLLSLPLGLAIISAGSASASRTSPAASATAVNSTSLGSFTPTFTGPAATGCATAGCSLLTGPYRTGSTADLSAAVTQKAAANERALAASASASASASEPQPHALPNPVLQRNGPDPTPPSVSCQPGSSGCSPVSGFSAGAVGVKGLNAVDSGTLSTNPNGDIEPSDQSLCAGNGYVVEANNIGEMMVFNNQLKRESGAISYDTIMGLTQRGWSSGGDISCLYDANNGGHFFFTEIVSTSSEASGGAFNGCFTGTIASDCFEGLAVSVGNSPFGPYNVYMVNANYNPNEPGYPYLFNDYAKIATTRDAFLLFYDEFPDNGSFPGIGGGFFNGAQEFAFSKTALELGEPVTLGNGQPNPNLNVAIENMGLVPTPDGTCASDNEFNEPGLTCWYQVIPAAASDPSQFDNQNNGTGFMVGTLDFYGQGDTREAVFYWTNLGALTTKNCNACNSVKFGGQLFNGLYYYGEGQTGAQKAGPIPLGDECGAAGLTGSPPALASCPEGGIASNGDGATQAAQANGQLYFALTTEVNQTFASESSPETHLGAIYYVVGTQGLNKNGKGLTLTANGYVSAAHEDMEFPTMAAADNGAAIMSFTVNGTGGPTGADNGGFYPSSAYVRLSSSGKAFGAANIVDLGQSPQDGFSEYQGLPGRTRPRWGDYGDAVYVPATGRIYFASQYIQYPNCTGSDFTLALATCGGTRDGFANWGTSVNYVTP